MYESESSRRPDLRAELPITFQHPGDVGTINIDEIVFAGFTRNGKAMYVYWWPPGNEVKCQDAPVTLSLAGKSNAQLTHPMLIDRLSATVYQLPVIKRRSAEWEIMRAPLADHPLIVTDCSVLLD